MRAWTAAARRVYFKVWIEERARVSTSLLRFICVARNGVVDPTPPATCRRYLEPHNDPVEVQAVTSVNVIFTKAVDPHDTLR
jgi:hypothetical protein